MGLITASVPGPGHGRALPRIRIEACRGCGACIITCPERALRPAPASPMVVAERCTGCGECMEICPVDAISDWV